MEVAEAFGYRALPVHTRIELRTEIEKGLSNDGVTVIVAKVPDRAQNVLVHEAMIAQVQKRRGA